MEPIDILDANGTYLGQSDRSIAHREGLWHRTFHCWVVGRRHGTGFVVLQWRSSSALGHPNMLDITAAGHLRAGEQPEDGVRELEEELGIKVSADKLVALGIRYDVGDGPDGFRSREFAHVFLLRDDRDLTAYEPRDRDVAGFVEMTIPDGLALFSGSVESVDCRALRLDQGPMTRRVVVGDLVPRVDSYYLTVFIMADLLLEGRRYLSI